MKRVLSLIILLAVLSSCGTLAPSNGKLRLVRLEKNEEFTVIERSAKDLYDIPPVKDENELIIATAHEIDQPFQLNEITRTDASISDLQELKRRVPIIGRAPEDLLPDEDERIINEALKAERDANTSFWLFLTGLSTVFVPYLGIIPFIIGLIFYSRSRKARYITPLGDRRSSAATVLLVIDSVILVFWLLLIVALILAF